MECTFAAPALKGYHSQQMPTHSLIPNLKKQKPSLWLGSLNSGAGLGSISTTNMLFPFGFIEKSRNQRPH